MAGRARIPTIQRVSAPGPKDGVGTSQKLMARMYQLTQHAPQGTTMPYAINVDKHAARQIRSVRDSINSTYSYGVQNS